MRNSIVYDYKTIKEAANDRLKPKPALQRVVPHSLGMCPKCGCNVWCGYDCKNRPWMKKSD